jgi:hypothetical protein
LMCDGFYLVKTIRHGSFSSSPATLVAQASFPK